MRVDMRDWYFIAELPAPAPHIAHLLTRHMVGSVLPGVQPGGRALTLCFLFGKTQRFADKHLDAPVLTLDVTL